MYLFVFFRGKECRGYFLMIIVIKIFVMLFKVGYGKEEEKIVKLFEFWLYFFFVISDDFVCIYFYCVNRNSVNFIFIYMYDFMRILFFG